VTFMGMDLNRVREGVARFPFWYHKIELPGGVITPGWAPLNPEMYRIPADLSGKRVLDVGAWDGYWTFEALKRGAREVVAIDDFSDYLGFLEKDHRKAWDTFDFCREALGYDDGRCRRQEMSVYDVGKAELGEFDTIFLFGVLYHLRHPLLALDRLSAVCRHEIHIESAILDDFSPYRGGLGQGYSGGQVVAEFYAENQYAENMSNWWVPTLQCLGQMTRAAGFKRVQGWKLKDSPQELKECRGFVCGSKTA
jgi:tRNA (mo5U34)-methyltransferase